MKWLIRLLLRVVTVILLGYFLSGFKLHTATDGETFKTAFVFVILLSVFNTILKPILSFFSLPITILTLGLFQLVINTLMVLLADYFVAGFEFTTFLSALFFSIIFSLASSIIEWVVNDKK